MRQIPNGGPVARAQMSPGIVPTLSLPGAGSSGGEVDSLARLVEMSLHILFPKAQECIHADVEATLRLLQRKRWGQRMKPG